MTALVVRADSRTLPLADNTVDLVVTSPPYFGLRSYQDGGEHYAGQVGDEATPAEFVAALLAVTAECVRVLKPTGSMWVNLGDKYGRSQTTKVPQTKHGGHRPAYPVTVPQYGTPKSLMGLPWRYALACIDELGLILRAEVIWSKPNGLPESVVDRVRRSHEQWFHFTLEPRYFAAVDAIREEHVRTWGGGANGGHTYGTMKAPGEKDANLPHAEPNPLGKLPGSVWTVPTQPLSVPAHLGVDHFAAFPMAWPRRIIRGWSPSGICTACGEGRRPVAEHAPWWKAYKAEQGLGDYMAERRDVQDQGARLAQTSVRIPEGGKHVITGEACACPDISAPTRPAVVLDPFGGTGTTALVASALGRTGISCDLSHDYSRLARWRTTDPAQRATAMQVEKPKAELPGQGDLFDEGVA